MLDGLPRLGLEPNAGCITTCGAAMLWHALVNITPGNNSPQLEHRKAASCHPNSPSTVDDLLRRLEDMYSASALMYADDLAIVASGAGHPCLCCGNATCPFPCIDMDCRAQPQNQRR
ncbi:hypothetical protein TcCL_NonESM03710 [Trypanosoma cruzi]|nr:hypothetical protein TcCL_NonESM03710 [Trypanosoma cruzi]